MLCKKIISGPNSSFATIFLAAFLFFLVQPIQARFILPWFGGGPGVWTACLLFFQCILLAGYGYAHASTRWLLPRTQASAHLAAVGLSLCFLPAIPAATWQPADTAGATWRVVALLAATVGLPAATLAATAPLLQGWFARMNDGTGRAASPYRLYALSNAGSLAALVAYPFVVEPLLARRTQAWLWAAGFVAYAVAAGFTAWNVWRATSEEAGSAITSDAGADRGPASGPVVHILWVVLAACGSALLASLTDRLGQDVAVVPFLWVLPLAIYLVTFIVCFERTAWYRRTAYLLMLAVAAAILVWQFAVGERPVGELISVYCAGLFIACMVCHGELHRLRPPHGRHTGFYLAIAAGGAIGGAFVAVVAPGLFATHGELDATLCLIGGCLAVIHHRERTTFTAGGRRWLVWPVVVAATATVAAVSFVQWRRYADGVLARSRNFHGTLRVEDVCPDDPDLHGRRLMHGTISHGAQFVDLAKARMPLGYYSESSGVGLAIANLAVPTGRRIGVVGLGAGTLAAYGRQGDVFRFYEIDPAVEPIARKWFTYLDGSVGTVNVITGDGRLTLEREANQHFDLLVLDAFSGDAIPVHLLTVDAFTTYLRHLHPSGVIAAHVSSLHLDLCRVMAGTVDHFLEEGTQLYMGYVPHPVGDEPLPAGVSSSLWILLTRNRGFLEQPAISRRCLRPPERSLRPVIWTDDHASVFAVLRSP